MSAREIILSGQLQRKQAETVLANLPINGTMQVTFEPVRRQRNTRQNSYMWCNGLLASIAEQAWVQGRQYSSEVWHDYCKRRFLPEGNEPEFPRMVMKGYRKWEESPSGERVLVGSTKQLTVYGMSVYSSMIEVFAAGELGVRLSAREGMEA